MLEHDKHCFMLNNCVGKHNRGYVLVYLGSTILLLCFVTFNALIHIIKVDRGFPGEDKHNKVLKTLVEIFGISSGTVLVIMSYYFVIYCKSHRRSQKRNLADRNASTSAWLVDEELRLS